jgi:hypothetical protein
MGLGTMEILFVLMVTSAALFSVLFPIDMHALVDDQRAMQIAEEYSDRRIMVRTIDERSEVILFLRTASGFRRTPSIRDQTSCKTTDELGCCETSSSNGSFHSRFSFDSIDLFSSSNVFISVRGNIDWKNGKTF